MCVSLNSLVHVTHMTATVDTNVVIRDLENLSKLGTNHSDIVKGWSQ